MSYRYPLPLRKGINFLGNYSYSIYLFQALYFRILEETGVLEVNSVPGAVAVVCLLPALFLVCYLLEKMDRRLTALLT